MQRRQRHKRTAFREYALSSASERASTKRRRKLGRLEGYKNSEHASAAIESDTHHVECPTAGDVGGAWVGDAEFAMRRPHGPHLSLMWQLTLSDPQAPPFGVTHGAYHSPRLYHTPRPLHPNCDHKPYARTCCNPADIPPATAGFRTPGSRGRRGSVEALTLALRGRHNGRQQDTRRIRGAEEGRDVRAESRAGVSCLYMRPLSALLMRSQLPICLRAVSFRAWPPICAVMLRVPQ
jgi:hypothetical protein